MLMFVLLVMLLVMVYLDLHLQKNILDEQLLQMFIIVRK